MKNNTKYFKNQIHKQNSNYDSQLTYLRYKDNYPLQIKGNMKRRIKGPPQNKQVHLGSIKTYHSQKNIRNSGSFLSKILQKGQKNVIGKQKKHYIPYPQLSQNPEFYFRYQRQIPSKHINYSKYYKLTHDLQDNLDLSISLPLNKSISSKNLQFQKSMIEHTGKRTHYQNNLFKESSQINVKADRYSMRKPNPYRTRSSIKIG